MSDEKHIERLNEKLYSRTKYKAPKDEREPISPAQHEAPQDWETPSLDELINAERRSVDEHPLLRKIFTVAIVFFICASAAAALIYFNGDNFISTRNLDISINAPVNISAGSPVDLEITILNKNNATLGDVSLTIEYPEGTRSAEDSVSLLEDQKEELDSISSGGRVVRSERAIFLGTAGEVKKILVSVTYKVTGSNATFTKEKPFELTIGSAPVSVSIVRPETVTSGEPFVTTISITANSQDILKNVSLRAEYPYGWSVTSSDPNSSNLEKNRWSLGDLAPGEKKNISLRGVLLGEDNEERNFRFFVSSGSGADSSTLSANTMSVTIRRPAVDMSLRLNGEISTEYVAPAGRPIQALLTIKNNLPEILTNPRLEISLSGTALDKSSVSTQSGGVYSPSQNTIVWNNVSSENFNSIAPGETKTFAFSFNSLANLSPSSSNQRIDLTSTLSGRLQNTSSEVRLSENRTIKIASEVSLNTNSLYSRGPFSNSGPIPPKADTATTYTIAITLGNTQNEVFDGQVVGTLGPNVEWVGETQDSDRGFIYNPTTRTVTWDVGTIPSGAGFTSATKEAYFKVSLTPSLGQVGGVPVLLSNVFFEGRDGFTETAIRVTNPSVTTRITTDPSYVQGDEIVVK